MAERTAIGWTDHTFNPVIGCQDISPGCANCYAAAYAKRVGRDFARRTRTSAAYWRQPLKWNRAAREAGVRRRVFCASLADVFDNQWPDGVREDLWNLIRATPDLDWQLLTKRIGNAAAMLPPDFSAETYPNVWLGMTAVTQDEIDRDGPKLARINAAVRFLSLEPLLEHLRLHKLLAIGWSEALRRWKPHVDWGFGSKPTVQWVICGGESGPRARRFDARWARSLRHQCAAAGVPFFMKQMGRFVVDRNDAGFDAEWNDYDASAWPSGCGVEHDINGFREQYQGADCRVLLRHRAGADPAEWPKDLRVQQFPTIN